MSTIVTETAEYDNSALPQRPQDGETIYMDGGSAPQWPLWARLYNRTALHELVVGNYLAWDEDFAVDSGGTSSSFTVRVGAIHSMHALGVSTNVWLTRTASTAGAAQIEGGGNLANSTWYYVYAYNSSGSIAYQITTTAPAAGRKYKGGSGGSLYNYLGCFRTLSTGAPIPVRAHRGRYIYNFSGSAVADTRALNVGSATSNTAVDLAGLVPPHSRIATLRAEVVSTTGSAINYAYLRTEGESGADEVSITVPATNAMSNQLVLDIITDADQDVAYRVTSNTSAPTLTLYVLGFYE